MVELELFQIWDRVQSDAARRPMSVYGESARLICCSIKYIPERGPPTATAWTRNFFQYFSIFLVGHN